MFQAWNALLLGNGKEWGIELLLIPIALIYANWIEWFVHKYVLHGLGKNPKSFWSFHWGEHHKNARRNHFYDEDYTRSLWYLNAQSKEVIGLLILGTVHLPLVAVVPFFYFTLVSAGIYYYAVHRHAHLNPDWAKAHLPWHYDHHMGPNQNLNWCVTYPLFDRILGTRTESISNSVSGD